MAHRIEWISLSLLLVLTGCIVTSIHPLYTEEVIVFEEHLLGEWAADSEEESVLFTRNGRNGYRVIFKEEGAQRGFHAYLLRLDDVLFLDIFPGEEDLHGAGAYSFYFLPLHTFMLVKQIEPILELADLEYDWLKSFLTEDPEALAYEVVEDRIILTASSGDLQSFLVRHIHTEGAYSPPDTLRRLSLDPTE